MWAYLLLHLRYLKTNTANNVFNITSIIAPIYRINSWSVMHT